MQIQIESVHAEPGGRLTNLINSKFEHLAKKFDRIHHCDVVLKEDKSDVKQSFFMEAKIEVPGSMLFASEKAESFETALSGVMEDLEHQLRRYKEELEERR